MSYYTINCLPHRQDTETIVTKFGKFRYNCIPMGMCDSGDIFQDKVYKLLCYIKCIKIYIHDISLLRKESFSKHKYQLGCIFARLHATGLKLNSPTCSFELNGIPYIGYKIYWEGIKPDPKKVQGIMDLCQPTFTTEV